MSSNFDMMKKRFEWRGGIHQEDRIIKDKWRAFQKALYNSYQGCDVTIKQKQDSCEQLSGQIQYRALINPDKTKQDYDDKILSIDYDTGYRPGDIFTWVGTNSQWLIYLEQMTEDSYFHGEIRLCRYKIKFKNESNETVETWAAIRGPVETAIDSIQKNQVRIDRPNWTLEVLVPYNEDTDYAFDRYSEFLFQGKCWRITATDHISIKGVLQFTAEEYYIDRDTDDVDNELKNGLVVEKVDPSPETEISGETFIKPKIAEQYSVTVEDGTWSLATAEPPSPVKLETIDSKTVKVTWWKSTSGQFTLQWTDGTNTYSKVIVVESLF